MLNNKTHSMWALRLGGGNAENFALEEGVKNGQHRPGQLFIDAITQRLTVTYRDSATNSIRYFDMLTDGDFDSEKLEAIDIEAVNASLLAMAGRILALEKEDRITSDDVSTAIINAISEWTTSLGDDLTVVSGVSQEEMQAAISEAIAGLAIDGGGVTQEEMQTAISEALAGLAGGVSMEQVNTAIAEAIAGLDLTAATEEAVDAYVASANIPTQEDLTSLEERVSFSSTEALLQSRGLN